jgi:type II secretory pathway predicted ATPase ExeA
VTSSGFILIDSDFRPISADPESIKILGFPNAMISPHSLDEILTQKIRSFLPADILSSKDAILAQFESGKRHYLCRAFVLENHWDGAHHGKRIALLLERGLSGSPTSAAKQRKAPGMREDPFGFAPDPKYFNLTKAHRDVINSLSTLVREGMGIGVILGHAGMGKTILLNYLTGNLRAESDIAYFPWSFENRADLVRAVMAIFGVDCDGVDLGENLRIFRDWLLAKNLAGRRVVLVCDDAQNLTFKTLENLCLLSDLQAGGKKLLQILFAGKQELLDKINAPRLEKAAGSIAVFCRLMPLDESEVSSYVLHRLHIAGRAQQVFSSEALCHIALYSRGIPQNINMICRHCLSLAAVVNLPIIDDRIVADSAYDLVLRSQPSNRCDDPQTSRQGQQHRRTHHGLRLVKT